jgi:hypothetical protein
MPDAVCEIVARVMEQPSVALGDRLEDLGCDELDRLTIAGEVEQHFDLNLAPFEEAEVTGWNQVVDIAESVVRAVERLAEIQAKLEGHRRPKPT